MKEKHDKKKETNFSSGKMKNARCATKQIEMTRQEHYS